MAQNYRKIFAIKSARENKIKDVCPDITNASGIYVFYRVDENGIKRAYAGQAVSLLERCASHLGEYDHLALSLKKHGFCKDGNPYGWKIIFKECEKDELDAREIETIRQFADNGFQMYNVSLGAQGTNRLSGQLSSRKLSKGYRDGIQQGKKSLAKELSHIIEKHLIVDIKPEKKNNKVSMNALEKFNELLDEKNYEKGDNIE